MLTLALDASTYQGSVAVVKDACVLAERVVAMRGEREERLMPAVSDALSAAGTTVRDLERVVCGAGPGSFTSLRIAASIAKGVAMGRDIPLLAVPSLLLVVAGAQETTSGGRYLAVLDAMRGEVYAAGYEVRADSGFTELEPPVLIPRSDVAETAARLAARPIGPAEPLRAVPRASGVARLATWLRDDDLVVDRDRWEPDYGRLAEAQVRWEATHGRALPRS